MDKPDPMPQEERMDERRARVLRRLDLDRAKWPDDLSLFEREKQIAALLDTTWTDRAPDARAVRQSDKAAGMVLIDTKTHVAVPRELLFLATLEGSAADAIRSQQATITELVEALERIDALDPEGNAVACRNEALLGLIFQMGAVARAALTKAKGQQTGGADSEGAA